MQTNAHEYLFTFYKPLLWTFSPAFSTLACVQAIHISRFKSHSISVFTANGLSNISSWGITPDDSPCSAVAVKTVQLLNSIPNENWKALFSSDHTGFSKGPYLMFSEWGYLFFSFPFYAHLSHGWRKVWNSSLPSWWSFATLSPISIPSSVFSVLISTHWLVDVPTLPVQWDTLAAVTASLNLLFDVVHAYSFHSTFSLPFHHIQCEYTTRKEQNFT